MLIKETYALELLSWCRIRTVFVDNGRLVVYRKFSEKKMERYAGSNCSTSVYQRTKIRESTKYKIIRRSRGLCKDWSLLLLQTSHLNGTRSLSSQFMPARSVLTVYIM